ncbi:MAG: hypothetical protein LBT22_00285 [Peptococcaceae bacterium]|jgi:hypothetical protein|nr:hypothetical protein [Peptococcaceae bacterium]
MDTSDPKIQTLKEDVAEIKVMVKEVSASMNEMRVFLASSYVTKTEFGKLTDQNALEHERIKEQSKGQVPGWLLALMPVLTAVTSGLAVHVLTK